jgi:hypothetical protein
MATTQSTAVALRIPVLLGVLLRPVQANFLSTSVSVNLNPRYHVQEMVSWLFLCLQIPLLVKGGVTWNEQRAHSLLAGGVPQPLTSL